MDTQAQFRCESCGAGLTMPAGQRTLSCPFCASPHVAEGPLAARGEQPQFTIPHSKGERLARAALAQWQRKLGFFRQPGVRAAPLEDFKGLYLPGLLYSAVARASYSASIAEEYYVTETYTVMVNGKSQTRTRRVKKHEWRPLRGELDAYATDIVVSASKAIPNDELERIEPFDFRELRRYAPGLVAGWMVEDATRRTDECLALARGELAASIKARLSRFMPGEFHQDLESNTRVENESGELTLFPVWVMALRFAESKPPLRVLINGQTGQVGAVVPLSWPRIIIAAVLALALVGGVIAFAASAL